MITDMDVEMDMKIDRFSMYATAQGIEREDGFEVLPQPGHHEFKHAKQSILGTFKKIEELIANLDEIFSQTRPEFQQEFNGYRNKMAWFSECRKFLEKEKMKAVIFGSTSSGKSTTVNAILHKGLLPTGMGHVTNCILQIEGSGSARGLKISVKINDGKEEFIENLDNYLHQKENELSGDCILYITCPTSEYLTLKNDVIILDCPGLDKSKEHDEVIYNNCKDADVFVFVSDAKSTIRGAEVSFFERIEDPTVFILFNCWDLTEKNEREKQRAPELRRKHMKDANDFLRRSNKHMQDDDLTDKIYFVSAEESLESYESPEENTEQQFGRRQREKEFLQFERRFWKYTTDSALRTRFGSRIANAKQRFKDFKEKLKQITENLDKEEKKLKQAVDDLTSRDKSAEETIKCKEKERLTTILKLMEIEKIKKFADSYKPKEKMDNNRMWASYYKDLHKHVQNQIKIEFQQMLEKFPRDANETDRHGLQSCLKETKCVTETQDGIGSLQKKYDMAWIFTFELPKDIDVEYTWSFAPYALMKKYVRYSSYHQQQSTTSAGRAILQIGGICTAMAVAAASSFTIPVFGAGAAALSYLHYNYDQRQWTTESKIEYLQEMCAADIHYQFEEKYKTEFLEALEELDKTLLHYFNKRLDINKSESTIMYEAVRTLNKKLKKSESSEIISKGENKLDEFEKKFLRPDLDEDYHVRYECAQCEVQPCM